MYQTLTGAAGAGMILLTVSQAAERLNVSTSYLNKLRVRGGGPTFCKVGRRVGYRVRDLENWLDACQHASTSEVMA